MSRFYESDEDRWNGGDLWTHRAHLALTGKRGRKALGELREALLALPEKRLIEGALCTVGLAERLSAREVLYAEIERRPGPEVIDAADDERFDQTIVADHARMSVERQGEGVCAIGAYVWWQKIKSGMDAIAAFAAIARFGFDDYEDEEYSSTVDAGRAAGLTFTLAWELGFRNDDTYGSLSPEQRYDAFLAFIDHEMAKPPLGRSPAVALLS